MKSASRVINLYTDLLHVAIILTSSIVSTTSHVTRIDLSIINTKMYRYIGFDIVLTFLYSYKKKLNKFENRNRNSLIINFHELFI